MSERDAHKDADAIKGLLKNHHWHEAANAIFHDIKDEHAHGKDFKSYVQALSKDLEHSGILPKLIVAVEKECTKQSPKPKV